MHYPCLLSLQPLRACHSIRTVLTVLFVIFYASSLLIVIANIDQPAVKEIYAKWTALLKSTRAQSREDSQLGSDEGVPDAPIGVDMTQPVNDG